VVQQLQAYAGRSAVDVPVVRGRAAGHAAQDVHGLIEQVLAEAGGHLRRDLRADRRRAAGTGSAGITRSQTGPLSTR
jgi:hypothetical protein